MPPKITLTDDQRSEIQNVIGHDLTESTQLPPGDKHLTLNLTAEQRRIIRDETGKDLSELELTEEDFKTLSSTAEYERGLTVNVS